MPLTNGSWFGSGSGSGCGSGSCYFFVIDIQDANKKLIFLKSSAHYFLKVHLHHFSKLKKLKKNSQSNRNQGFSYYFCLVNIEGSGSGSKPQTNGSGSGSRRPKNIRIWRIRTALEFFDMLFRRCFQTPPILKVRSVGNIARIKDEGQTYPQGFVGRCKVQRGGGGKGVTAV